MKENFEQPELPDTSSAAQTEPPRNTLKRITLALLEEGAAEAGKTGFDPYNSTEGTPAVDVWKRSAERR